MIVCWGLCLLEGIGNLSFNLQGMRIRGNRDFLGTLYVSRIILQSVPILFMALALSMCKEPSPSSNTRTNQLPETADFKSYWYSGKAEISSFKLEQSRYGEPREGSAVLIFVTEDFSRKKQVKLDNPSAAGDDKVTVLKMNFMKNFVTGIYPYSMMLSVFKAITGTEYPHALKAAMSSQEWCGQVFSQMNLDKNKYAFQGHSYFEKEGEEDFTLDVTWLEDELWSQIRLDPTGLPTGEVKIIPGLFFTRLKHSEMKPLPAFISSSESPDGVQYSIDFVEQARKLTITYQRRFPHRILGWEESFVERGQTLTTKAILDKSMMINYWMKNKNEFQYLRDSLGLSRRNF
jgi:hypothetical protein